MGVSTADIEFTVVAARLRYFSCTQVHEVRRRTGVDVDSKDAIGSKTNEMIWPPE